MTLDPAGLEAAAKLARSCTPTAREDARLAEQIVRAYLAATPDPPKPPPPPLVDGSPYPIPASAVPAASPDERLREADRRVILEWAKFTRDEAAGYWGRREEDVYQRLLAAADREKPDGPKEKP